MAAVVLVIGLVLAAGPASAQVEPHDTAPPPCVNCDGGSSSTTSTTGGSSSSSSTTEDTGSSVLPSSTERVPGTEGGPEVGGTSTGRGALSRTGTDVAPQLLLAGVLLLSGTVVSIAARRRRRQAYI